MRWRAALDNGLLVATACLFAALVIAWWMP